MANANESPKSANVTLSLFGGLFQDVDAVNCPQGVSPANSDCMFLQGSVGTRSGLSKTYATQLPADVVYAKTYTLQDGTVTTLLLCADGNLYQEFVSTQPGTWQAISAGTASLVSGGDFLSSTSTEGREYFGSFNLTDPGGAAAPFQWDGTTLTRITQDGPGNAMTIQEQNLQIAVKTITQPKPLGALPTSQPISVGATTINFYKNATGVYGEGNQPLMNTVPYTGGTSLVFNQFNDNFPITGFQGNWAQSPMSQIQQDANGQFTGQTFFPESDTQKGGMGYGFDANIQSTITVAAAGTVTFYILADDTWILFMGPEVSSGAASTYVSGPQIGAATSKAGLPYIASRDLHDAPSGIPWDTVVISFAAAGTYPIEIGWSNWSDGPQCTFQMTYALGNGPTAGGDGPVGSQLLPPPATGDCVVTENGTTATMVTPSPHPFGVGDLALVAGFSVVGFNGLQTVTSVPSPKSFTYDLIVTGLLTSSGGTVAPVTATFVTETPSGLIVGDGFQMSGNSEPLYNTSYDNTSVSPNVVNPALWNVKAVINPLTFQADLYQSAGVVGTGGTLTAGGLLSPGIHKAVCFFELEDGTQTKPGPVCQWGSTGSKKFTVFSIPIGPPNTKARVLAFTAANGGNYFYLPVDVIGTQSTLGGNSAPAKIGTSTRIPDNTTNTATFDFADASLLAATAIDVPGNDLFNMVTLAPVQGVIEYSDRLFTFGEWNKLENFVNMTMSGGASSGVPPGWTGDGLSGHLIPANLGLYAWNIIGDGTNNPQGLISQTAYQDSLNVPILSPNQSYLWRAFVQPGSGADTSRAGRQFADQDNIGFGNPPSLYISGDWSFGCWIKLPSNAQGNIVAFGDAGSTSPGDHFPYLVFLTANATSGFDINYSHDGGTSAGITNPPPLTFTTGIPAGVWVYVGVSRTVATSTVTVYLSYDGVTLSEFGAQVYTEAVNTAPQGGGPVFRIGELATTGLALGGIFAAESMILSDCYMWNASLDQSDQSLAMSGAPPTASLVFDVNAALTPVTSTAGVTMTGVITGTTLVGAGAPVTGSGFLNVDFYSPTVGLLAIGSVSLASISSLGQWVSVEMNSSTPAAIPTDTILRLYGTGIANETAVGVRELMVIPANIPVNGSQLRASYAYAPTQFDGVTGLIQVDTNEPIVGCFVQDDTLYIQTATHLYKTEDNGSSEPSGWACPEVNNKIGGVSARGSAAGELKGFLACEPGIYLFVGSTLSKISQEIAPTWSTINWQAKARIWCVNDSIEKTFYCGVPTGTNTVCDTLITIQYRSIQEGTDIPEPVHTSFSGKILSTENTRKTSIWARPSYGGALLKQNDGSTKFVLLASGFGNTYKLNAGQYHDDDFGKIPSFYVTYFFCGPDDEQAFAIGSHRKLGQYLTGAFRGVGNVLITPYGDDLDNPLRPCRQKPLYMSATGSKFYDTEMPLNVVSERMAFRIEPIALAGSLDAAFSVRRLVLSITEDPYSPIGGRA